MVHKKITLLLFVILVSCSCGRKAKPAPLEYIYDDDYSYSSEVIVPFKDYGGVRTIQVKINNCSEFPMIFDTGCSGLTLSIAEVYVLAKQGCISADDIEGYGYSTIADGSIVQNMIINLHEIKIGDLACRNVKASVSDNENAPLLLGNGVLNQVESFSTDNVNKTIRFVLK